MIYMAFFDQFNEFSSYFKLKILILTYEQDDLQAI